MVCVQPIGVGNLSVELDTDELSPGDVISGALKLDLTEPIEAERLVVGALARQRPVPVPVPAPAEGEAPRRTVAWRVERVVARTGTFHQLGKRFTLKLPAEVPQGKQLEWYVFAYLDRPWAVNVKVRVPIAVRTRRRAAAGA